MSLKAQKGHFVLAKYLKKMLFVIKLHFRIFVIYRRHTVKNT